MRMSNARAASRIHGGASASSSGAGASNGRKLPLHVSAGGFARAPAPGVVEGGLMSLLSRLRRTGPSGFGYASTAELVTRGLDLHSKTILLTGCNSGLGRETLRVLSLRGA